MRRRGWHRRLVEGFRSTGGRSAGRHRDLTIAISLCLVGFGVDRACCRTPVSGSAARSSGRCVVAGAGVALLWWQSDQRDRTEWLTSGRGWKAWLRIVIGALLIGAAMWLALFQAGVSGAIDDVLGRRTACRRRHRAGDRSVAAPADPRPATRAARAHPQPGAGRRRRAPARLGAADAGADPAPGRRRADRGAPGANPGARAAYLAVRQRRPGGVDPQGGAAARRRRGRGPAPGADRARGRRRRADRPKG